MALAILAIVFVMVRRLTRPLRALAAAADGLGIAIGYLELIDKDLHSGNLVIACDQPVKHAFSYYLVYRRSLKMNVSLQQFRDWLAGQL